jgi:hypothetical protein
VGLPRSTAYVHWSYAKASLRVLLGLDLDEFPPELHFLVPPGVSAPVRCSTTIASLSSTVAPARSCSAAPPGRRSRRR